MAFFTKESVESVNNKPVLKTTPTIKKDMKEKNNIIESNTELDAKVFNSCIDYFTKEQSILVNRLNESLSDENYMEVKNNILNIAKTYFKNHCTDSKSVDMLMDRFTSYMFGYYILEPLLQDEELSDIKVYSWDNIRVKRLGKREGTGLSFLSEEDYRRFTRTVCARNKVPINNINAYPKFSDTINNPLFRLRINLSDAILNENNQTTFHIRLEPKKKVTFDKLVKRKYMTETQKNYLIKKWVDEEAGMLFVGSNGSGKTTGVNGMIEYTPHDKSILAIQETDELFIDGHPEFLSRHTIEDNGESHIRYGLKEHAKQALMDDWDVFALGEIKSGNDAASFPSIAATGSQIISTSHGDDELEGLYKIGDYIKQAADYDLNQCMRFLLGFKVVCFVKNYQIKSISEVQGWDYQNNCLKVVKLDENCNPVSDNNIDNSSLNKFFFKL